MKENRRWSCICPRSAKERSTVQRGFTHCVFFKQPFSVMDMGKLRGKLKTLIDTVILKNESKELHLSFGLYAASVWFSSGAHQTT